MFATLKIFLLLWIGVSASTFTGPKPGVFWRSYNNQDILKDMIGHNAVGVQPGATPYLAQYLCKGLHNGRHLVGKIHFIGDNIQCYIAEEKPAGQLDQVFLLVSSDNQDKIQVFAVPPMLTSWVPLRPGGEVPKHFVPGGELTVGGQQVPICRAKKGNYVYVGFFNENTGECIHPMNFTLNKEIEIIEILVLNTLGQQWLSGSLQIPVWN